MRKLGNQRGFTLMELMVVIVIVAILAAVAVPLYINYVKDAKRTEAKGAIAAVISAQQIYFQKTLAETGTGGYSTDSNLYAEAGDGTDLKVDLVELQRSWDLTVAADDPATSFTVKAVGKNDAAGLTVCCTYVRTPTDANAGATWNEDAACSGS